MTYKYIIHKKRIFTDGLGEILAISNSVGTCIDYVREHYPDHKYDGEAYINEADQTIVMIELYGPIQSI